MARNDIELKVTTTYLEPWGWGE